MDDKEGISISFDYLSVGFAKFLEVAEGFDCNEILRVKVENLYQACNDAREKYDKFYNAVKKFEEDVENSFFVARGSL